MHALQLGLEEHDLALDTLLQLVFFPKQVSELGQEGAYRPHHDLHILDCPPPTYVVYHQNLSQVPQYPQNLHSFPPCHI